MVESLPLLILQNLQITMPLCYHCNAIDINKLISLASHGKTDMRTHHRTFRALKESAESCQLCALFVAGLKKPTWEFDYDRAYEPGDKRGMWYEGVLGEADQSLTGMTMVCQGSFATLDIYADEGLLSLYSHSSRLLCDSGSRMEQPQIKLFPEGQSVQQMTLKQRNDGSNTVLIITPNVS